LLDRERTSIDQVQQAEREVNVARDNVDEFSLGQIEQLQLIREEEELISDLDVSLDDIERNEKSKIYRVQLDRTDVVIVRIRPLSRLARVKSTTRQSTRIQRRANARTNRSIREMVNGRISSIEQVDCGVR
jgi:predicted metalloprotease